MPQVIQSLVNAWSVNFYGSWSIMDVFSLIAFLTLLGAILNYFFNKAGS